MRTKNRIVVGALVFAFSAYLFLPIFSPKAVAATLGSTQQLNAFAKTLTYQDSGTIVGQLSGDTIVFKKTCSTALTGQTTCSFIADNLFCQSSARIADAPPQSIANPNPLPAGTYLFTNLSTGTGGKCEETAPVKLDLSKSESRANALVARINKSTLISTSPMRVFGKSEGIDVGEKFTIEKAGSKIYLRDSEKDDPDGCVDRVIVEGDKAYVLELKNDRNTDSNVTDREAGLGNTNCVIIAVNGKDPEGNVNKAKELARQTFVLADNVAGTGGSGDATIDDDANCDNSGSGPLGWILCPVFDAASGFTGFVFDEFIMPFLEDVPVSTNPEEGAYKAWNQFRILGNIILVLSMLGVVYSQARSDK